MRTRANWVRLPIGLVIVAALCLAEVGSAASEEFWRAIHRLGVPLASDLDISRPVRNDDVAAPSGIIIDDFGDVWIASRSTGKYLRLQPKVGPDEVIFFAPDRIEEPVAPRFIAARGRAAWVYDAELCSVFKVAENSAPIDPQRIVGASCAAGTVLDGVPVAGANLGPMTSFGVVGDYMFVGGCSANQHGLFRFRADGTGLIELWAGTGQAGSALSQFNCPTGPIIEGVTFGSPDVPSGIVVADTQNNQVKQIPAKGIVVLLAGTGFGSPSNGNGGPAINANIPSPTFVTWNPFTDNYLVGQINQIRQFSAVTGIINPFAGGATGGIGVPGELAINTPLLNPVGAAVTNDGTVYVGEGNGSRVSTISPAGVYDIEMGSRTQTHVEALFNGDLNGTRTNLSSPRDLRYRGGFRFDAGATFGSATSFTGDIVFTDSVSQRVRAYDPVADQVKTIAGNGQTPTADPATLGDGGPATSARASTPYGVAITSDGRVVFSEFAGCRIRQIDTAGMISTLAGSLTGSCVFGGDGGPAVDATLGAPMGVAVDADDNIYWTEQISHRVRKLTKATGMVTTVAGTGALGSAGDGGPATAAQLQRPFSLDIDSAGQKLYIADTFNHRVRVVDLAQNPPTIATLAGTGAFGFSGDGGPAAAAVLNSPYDITYMDGALYVADTNNHRIRRVFPLTGTPLITTIAGTGVPGFYGQNGPSALQARLFGPGPLAPGPDGSVLFGEVFGRRIGELQPVFAQTGPPGAPGTPTAQVNGNLVTFAWSAPASGAPPTVYSLLGRTTPSGSVVATLPIDGSLTSLTLTAPNGTFYVTLQASNAAGTGPESGVLTLVVPQLPAPPGAPSNLAAVISGSTVNFSWTPPATGGPPGTYTLVASLSPGGPTMATLPIATVTSFTVPNVPPGTYYVRLSASNAGGTGPFSNEVTVNVAAPSVPGAPTLSPANVFQRTVTLTWTPAATGGTALQFLVNASLTPGGVPLASITTANTTLTVPNVAPGTYYVTVRGANAVGLGPPSNEVTVIVN